MSSLWAETLMTLASWDKDWELDVVYVSQDEKEIPKNLFEEQAQKTYYEASDEPQINITLKLVGNGWWFERMHTSSGEWWEYKEIPQRPGVLNEDPNFWEENSWE